MTRTEFLGLSKREPNDKYNLAENNENLDRIDLFAQTIATGIVGIPVSSTGVSISLTDASNNNLKNLVVYGKTTQNVTPTPTAPVDLDSVENPVVKITGKNLLENKITSETVNGLTISANDDGSITVDGTSTASFSRTINSEIILPTGKYTISGGKETNARLEFRSVKTDGSTNAFQVTNVDAHTTITDDVVSSSVIIVFISGTVFDNFTFKPMIRLASITDGTYEPYKAQSISIPYTLNEGDYVDFEKSVLVKKTETYQLTSAMTWAKNSSNTRIYTILPDGIEKATNSNIYCTHAIKGSWVNSTSGTVCLGNSVTPVCGFATSDFATVEELKSWLDLQTDGVFIVVPLITPTENPLTAEELEAFKALHSYYPTTTITNSENAEMGVEYVADTKIYIDNKFAEINRAILNNI